ncbi:MAG TPA: acylphosphatase [Streptosporangiaceae bacterium]|nr:acylphosphatase [Streptosporangiaceae bacterium]
MSEPPEDSPLVGRRWLLVGRVQGVGFRWYVLNRAQALGVRGWVRNTPDGSVEVVGLATAATIDRLDALLAKGPPGARVIEVVRTDVPHEIVDGKSFTIRH